MYYHRGKLGLERSDFSENFVDIGWVLQELQEVKWPSLRAFFYGFLWVMIHCYEKLGVVLNIVFRTPSLCLEQNTLIFLRFGNFTLRPDQLVEWCICTWFF